MLEIEKTYLAKRLPEGLAGCPHIEMEDTYIPADITHPKLRLRRKDDRFKLTKKVRLDPDDASKQEEHHIELTADEYQALRVASQRSLRKIRYYFQYNGHTAEIDVFQDDLAGLVLVDFEFDSPAEQTAFKSPDFCLADVTQEDFIAGGILAGKSYSDIEADLQRFDYQKIPRTGSQT